MKLINILLIAVFCLALLFFLRFQRNISSRGSKTLYIKNQPIKVKIADTADLRSRGLSGVKNLPENEGMLFIFPSPSIYTFWMKEMYFPLDIIWINKDLVVDITANVPPPDDGESLNLPLYQPSEPVDMVLEINAGKADSLNIQIGERVILK